MSDNQQAKEGEPPKLNLYQEMLKHQLYLKDNKIIDHQSIKVPKPQLEPPSNKPQGVDGYEQIDTTSKINIDQSKIEVPKPIPEPEIIQSEPIPPAEEEKKSYVKDIVEVKRESNSNIVQLKLFCYHPSIKDFYEFFIQFRILKFGKQQPEFQRVNMNRLDSNDNFVYCSIDLNKKEWDSRFGIEYKYQIKDAWTYESDFIVRPKHDYKELHYFFDTPIRFQNSIKQAYTNRHPDTALSQYLGIFLKTYQQLDKSSIYFHYERFCYHSKLNVNLDGLFEQIENFLQYELYDAQPLMIFIFHVFYYTIKGNLPPATIFKFRKTMNAIQDIFDKDKLLKFYEEFKAKQILEGRQNLISEQGIRKIMEYSPVITIQFIDKREIIEEVKPFLEGLVFKSLQENHYQFKYIHDMIDMLIQWGNKQTLSMNLILSCILISQDVKDLLINMRKYWDITEPQEKYQQRYNYLKNKGKNFQEQILINLTEILEKEYGKVFIQDVERLIMENPKDIVSKIMRCDQLSYSALKVLAQSISEHSYGTIRTLLKEAVKVRTFNCSKTEILQVYIALAERIFKTTENLLELRNKVIMILIDIGDINVSSLGRIKYEDAILEWELLSMAKQVLDQMRDPVIHSQIIQFYKTLKESNTIEIFDLRIINAVSSLINTVPIQQLLSDIYNNPMLIQNNYVEQIIIKLFGILEGIYPTISLEQIFNDDVLLLVIQLKRYINKHRFQQAITEKISEFIQRMKSSNVYMIEIERCFINKGKNIDQIIAIIDPSFKVDEVIPQLIEEYNNNNKRIEKYENFITFALKLKHVIQTSKYETRLRNLRKLIQGKQLLELRNSPLFEYFDGFQSVDFLYHFRESNVFSNTFNFRFHGIRYVPREYDEEDEELKSEEEDDYFAEEELREGEAEELKVGIDPLDLVDPIDDDGADKYSIKKFDRMVLFEFVDNDSEGLTHYKKLIDYDIESLIYGEMNVFWKNVKDHQVEKEINIIVGYMNRNDNLEIDTSQLIVDLKNFCNRKAIYQQCKIITELQYAMEIINLHGGQEFNKLLNYTEFIDNIEEETLLNEVTSKVLEAQQLLHNLQQNQIIIDQFQIVSKCSAVYHFSIASAGQNFNDLYEKLEDNDLLSNSTINDMNVVASFFLQLKGKIEKAQADLDFVGLLKLIDEHLQQQLISDKTFNARLQNIIQHLDIIKNINNAATNLAQNTLKVVHSCFESGDIGISFNENINIYDIWIQYMVEKEMQLLNPEQTIQHSSRAILLGSSKQNVGSVEEIKSAQNEVSYEDINLFVEIVQISQDARVLMNELYTFGHLDHQSTEHSQKYKINRLDIRENLLKLKNDLHTKLKKWKIELRELRKKHYYLTYVPNRQLFALTEYIYSKEISQESKNEIYQIFRFINNEFDFRNIDSKRLKSLPENVAKDNSEKLNELGQWLDHEFKNIQERPKSIPSFNRNNNQQMKNAVIRKGKIQFYSVDDNNELIQAIIAIYALMEYVPMASEILFCNNNTKIHEVESFILRAMLIPSHLSRNRKKMFVIADFQALPLRTQIQAYEFMQKLETSMINQHNQIAVGQSQHLQQIQGNEYYLTVLFQKRNQKVMQKEDIIEELQNKDSFAGFIDKDLTKSFFQTFQKIQVLHSPISGLGKSKYAMDKVKEQNIEYKRIPIYGELTREKFVNLHKNKNIQISQQSKYGIHYDIYPTSKESLNIILFEALILNCVQIDNKIYHFPDNSFYYLELSQEVFTQFQNNEFFLNNFKQKEFIWDSTLIEINLDLNSTFQILAKYMDFLQHNEQGKERIKIDVFKNRIEPIPIMRCIELIEHYFLTQIQRPNFYILNSYLAFAGDNLRKLETNPFFISDDMLQFQFDRQGYDFYIQIIKLIIELSRKICTVDNSIQKQELEKQMYDSLKNEKDKDKRKALEQDFQALLLQELKWERNNTVFIMLNDEGSITPIYKDPRDIPTAITNYIKELSRQMGKELLNEIKPFEELNQDFIVQKILRMCSNEKEKEKIEQTVNVNRLVFTNDNFLKMALIYQRLRTSQPVVIMGETGVGKTAVINYLADMINYEFKVLNVHAGITEQSIIQFVDGVNKSCRDNPTKLTIIFFDEVNTNTNVQGLFKEIMIDRHLLGEPIHDNIRIAAACNPYKLKSQSAILNSISAGIKHQKMDPNVSRLVYTVQPLPESILSYIWDYGSLSQEEEGKYIQKMIQTMRNESEDLLDVDDQDINYIANCVYKSQEFIRKSDAQWAVSLRDVARFRKLFIYFTENTYNGDRTLERSFVLAICFCYLFRISSKENRLEFISLLINDKSGYMQLNGKTFEKILEDEYKVFLDSIEIPPGIGKNKPLKENIFVMITCILNQIPLFITGKPGSSKTLALNLVAKSMKGQASQKELFKRFASVISFTYQGSVQSTSKGIERIFDRAIKFTKDKEEKKEDLAASNVNHDKLKTIALVVIDEIGLAEISPHNPLKILHSLLEPPQVSFIGISNWSLDASKMNRAITLSRPDAKIQDLYDSALAISEEVNKNRQQGEQHHRAFQSNFVRELVAGYFDYHRQQVKENFHGLRDFYSLVSQICLKFSHFNSRQNFEVLKSAILRNFGGQDIQQVINCFKTQFKDKLANFEQVQTTLMITQNLEDQSSRHLMIITKNEEQSAIQFIESYFNSKQIEYRIFYGSDFSEDQQEEAAYKQIHDIILCMERGIYVVLLNLDYIYQSFYDMLNQNYQIIGNQRFCKVAIGPDSSKQLVHKDFKCILVTSKDQVDKMDAPLLNRFEKQLFSMEQGLTPEEKSIIDEVKEWVEDFTNIKEFTIQECFPMISNLQNTIIQIIKNIQIGKIGTKDLKSICINYLIQICNHAGIIRSQQSKRENTVNCIEEYFEKQKHFSMNQFINELANTWTDDYFYNEQSKGFNIVIQTYTSLPQDIFSQIDERLPHDPPIILSNVPSQRQLDILIERYFMITNKTEIMYIYADSSTDSNMRVSLCKNIVNNHRASYKKYVAYPDKHICLIIKVTDKYQGVTNFGLGWRDYFIDLLNGKGNTEVEVEKLVKSKLTEVFDDQDIFKNLLITSLSQIMSRIRYNIQSSGEQIKNDNNDNENDDINTNCFQISRIRDLQILIENRENTNVLNDMKNQFNELFIKNEKREDIDAQWQLIICNDKVSMISNQSFHASAIEYLKEFIIKYCRAIIYFMESNGVFFAYFHESKKESSREICSDVFREVCLPIENFNQSYILQKGQCYQLFPYILLINDKFQQLKRVFQSQIRQLEFRRDIRISLDSNLQGAKSQSDISLDLQNIYSDADIVMQINQLKQQCGLTFPDYLKTSSFLFDFNDDFLLDLPDICTNGAQDKKYYQIFNQMIRITVNNRLEDVYTIYGAFWINETFVDKLWKIYTNNKDLIKEENFLPIIEEMQVYIRSNNNDISIITSYYFEEALLLSLYNHIKLTNEIIGVDKANYDQISTWAQRVDKLLIELRDLNILQSTKEMKTLEFQRRFCQKLVIPLSLDSEIVMTIVDTFTNVFDPFAMFKRINEWINQQQQAGFNVNVYKNYVYGFLEEQFQDQQEDKLIPFMKKCFDLIIFDYKKFALKNDFILIVQSIIKKIINIVYSSQQQTFENYLMQESELNEHEYMSVLTHFITKIEGKINHSLCILFTDSLEQVFESQQYDFEITEVRHYFENSLNIIFDQLQNPLKRVISIAFVRRNCKHRIDIFIQDLLSEDKKDPSSTIVTALNCFIEQRVQVNSNVESILMIYILKLLNQKLSLIQIIQEASQHMPWIKELKLTPNQKLLYYVKQRESLNQVFTFINKKAEMKQKLMQYNHDHIQTSSIYMGLFQHFYLNNNQDNGDIASEVRAFTIGQPVYQNFTRSIITNSFEGMSDLFNQKDNFLPELLAYVFISTQNSCESTVFKELIKDFKKLENIYIPFIANTIDDFQYKVVFDQEDIIKMNSGYKGFMRYQCVRCNEILVVGDCGQLSSHWGKGGTGFCQGCGIQVGNGFQQNLRKLENGRVVKESFTTDNEAKKGYIILDPEQNQILEVRQINDIARKIGYIINHCVFLCYFMFSTQQQQLAIPKYVISQKRLEEKLEAMTIELKLNKTLQFLTKQINYTWGLLKEVLNLNDQRVLIIFENTLQLMMEHSYTSPEFQILKFEQIQGRKEFEKYFQEHCVVGMKDNFSTFFNELQNNENQISNPFLLQIEEKDNIDNYLEEGKILKQHFRLQTKINAPTFITYLSYENSKEAQFIKLVYSKIEEISLISNMKPLINWANYTKAKFNGKIKKEEAFDIRIEEQINTLNSEDEKQTAKAIFTEFENAWNEFAGKEFKEGCDTIKIYGISNKNDLEGDQRPRFQQFCLTKRANDSLGFTYYLLLSQLYKWQNMLLEQAHEILEETEPRNRFLLQLRTDQMIVDKVDINYFERLVQSNAFNDIQDGNGRKIHYNIPNIYQNLYEKLVMNKVYIDEDEDLDFQYQNNGQLYQIYDEILSKIKQVRFPEVRLIINDIQVSEKCQFHSQLLTALSFLSQTGGNPESTVIGYMRAFDIQSPLLARIGHGARLKHILHIYEIFEESILGVLVKKTHQKYKKEIEEDQKQILLDIIQGDQALSYTLKLAVGRICYRQFTEQSLSENGVLLQDLFGDFNLYLYGIETDANLDDLMNKFANCSLTYGNAYHLYKLLRKQEQAIEEQRQHEEQQKEEQKKVNEEKAAEKNEAENDYGDFDF